MRTTQMNQDRDRLAAIGIGAMIVFIALILVAAVASAVIIQTGEKLQQNAQATGQDTTDSLAGRINILGVSIKEVAATGADFGADPGDAVKLTLTFKTGAGSDEIREDQIRIVITCDGRGTGTDAGIIVYQGIDLADLEGAVTGTTVAGSALTNASTGDNNVMVSGAVYTTELSLIDTQPADHTDTNGDQNNNADEEGCPSVSGEEALLTISVDGGGVSTDVLIFDEIEAGASVL